MTILTKPSVLYPENTLTSDDIVHFIENYHPDSQYRTVAIEMIKHTTIEQRQTCVPFEAILNLKGFEGRQRAYEHFARQYSKTVAEQAIINSGLDAKDITMVIAVSCTGFMMPSLTAHLINVLGLNQKTIQLPVAQMGCVAGAYAMNRAYEHCQLSKSNNALIVALEASSLCFDPEANQLQDFVSDAIFGDGAASVVMKGDGLGKGLYVQDSESIFLKDTENYIQYQMTDKGFLFSLDKKVMYSIEMVAPYLNQFVSTSISNGSDLDFTIAHTGGRRILDELEKHLSLSPDKLQHSRASLREHGNTSSVSVIDVLYRHFATAKDGDKGILVAFGPGFTSEVLAGQWQD
ncbi:type III polyketide synthase [Vibrio harveyi]|uniref:type III polyketide synthase n=1 Tax=Vibrio harveyi TaxID=669 RepID=UPI0023809B98|nr:type III polyketide synthase [Vibrio harveyi]